MAGFDWNKNGKRDNFDRYMDMKVMSNVSEDEETEDCDVDFDCEEDPDFDFCENVDEELNDDEDNIDVEENEIATTISPIRYNNVKIKSSESEDGVVELGKTEKIRADILQARTKLANLVQRDEEEIKKEQVAEQKNEEVFQNELKKNMKTPEMLQQEKFEEAKKTAFQNAEYKKRRIKELLLQKVRNGEYKKENGITSVSCICEISNYYLKSKRYSNFDQYNKNPRIAYKEWEGYDIDPDNAKEYHFFMNTLKELLKPDNISIEPVVRNISFGVLPFPTIVDKTYGYVEICVRATTIIEIDPNYKPSTNDKSLEINKIDSSSKKIKPAKQTDEFVEQQKRLQEQNSENWAMTGKCFLVVGIIILAFIICLNADIGPLGMALLLIGSVVLGCIILMRSSK